MFLVNSVLASLVFAFACISSWSLEAALGDANISPTGNVTIGINETRVATRRFILTRGVASPDGVPSSFAVLVNGKWPAPTLRITQGDTLRLSVLNLLGHPTAIHFVSSNRVEREREK